MQRRLIDVAGSHPGQEHLTGFLRCIDWRCIALIPDSCRDVLPTDALIVLSTDAQDRDYACGQVDVYSGVGLALTVYSMSH